jgi:hypothetical protein
MRPVNLGKPFSVAPDLEIEVVNYIISMQDLYLGLTIKTDSL